MESGGYFIVSNHIMDTTETNILTTSLSLKTIGFGLFGTIFFGAFAYMALPTREITVEGVSYVTGMIIVWLIFGCFVFLASACFVMLLTVKTFVLTDKSFLIKRPLLFLTKTIPLAEIKSVAEGDFKINPSHAGGNLNVYSGDKTIIELKNGKKIKYNSFEISDYYIFNGELQRVRRNISTKNATNIYPACVNNKYSGYGWLIFLIVLTLGLVYALISQRLEK